ncbi:MAG: hypothetical protein IKP86_05370, partial [Anaerolineaceae bacterium]|nr:hypothetical protein [Anaerolineaceae bacterium]
MEDNYGIRDFSEINAVLARMSALLNAGDFQQADGCCDYVLHLLPGYGPAYLGKLLAEFGLKAPNELLTTEVSYTGSENYRNALCYGDAETQRFLRT